MANITAVDEEGEGDSGSGVKHAIKSKLNAQDDLISESEGKHGQKSKSEDKRRQKSPPFLEVLCKSSGKIRRFSIGTESGFAVSLINKKSINGDGGGGNGSSATYIEAVKEGEEPVSFGPNSLLVDYGSGWKLQTVVESHGNRGVYVRTVRKESSNGNDDPNSERRESSPLSLAYVGKILLAFVFMFVVGAAFTLALENLPQLLSYISTR